MKRLSLAFISLCGCSLLISGCARLGPDYQRPEMELPQVWRFEHHGVEWQRAQAREIWDTTPWWEIFDDPVLNDLQDQALEANQSLKAAIAHVDEARALAGLSKADFFPDAEVNAAAERFKRSSTGFGGSGGFQNNQFSLPLDMSYEVDVWGRIRRAYEAAKAEAHATQSEYYTVRLTLNADVALFYFRLRELDVENRILQETVGLRQEAKDLVSKRLEAGIASEFDLVRVQTELSQVEVEAAEVKRQRVELENALAVLCGRIPSGFEIDADPHWSLVPPTIPVSVPSSLLESRPDIAEAEQRMIAANARIGVAKAAFFPVVRLSGSAGYQNSMIENVLDADSLVWSIGPSVTVPIFAGGRARANLQASRASYEAEVAEYRQQVLNAFREVEDALAGIKFREEQTRAQRRVVESAREAAQISTDRYREGLVNFFEALDSERSRLSAELADARLHSNRLQTTVLLIKALGGLWNSGER